MMSNETVAISLIALGETSSILIKVSCIVLSVGYRSITSRALSDSNTWLIFNLY